MNFRCWVAMVSVSTVSVGGWRPAHATEDAASVGSDLGAPDASFRPDMPGANDVPVPPPGLTAPPLLPPAPPPSPRLTPAPPAPPPLAIPAAQDPAVELAILQERVAAAHAHRVRVSTRERNAGIVVTSIGLAVQLAGALALGLPLASTHPAYTTFETVGSSKFIEAATGVGLTLIGVIMWPAGATQWYRGQHDLNELHRSPY